MDSFFLHQSISLTRFSGSQHMYAVISFGCILVFLYCLKSFILFLTFLSCFSPTSMVSACFFLQLPAIGSMPIPSPAGLRLSYYTCWLINLITFYIPSLQILTEAVSWGNHMPFMDSSSCNQWMRIYSLSKFLLSVMGKKLVSTAGQRLWLLSWTWVWMLTLWPWATLWSFKFFLHRWPVGVHVSIFRVKTPARGWSSAQVGNCGRAEVDVCALVQCYIRLGLGISVSWMAQ